MNFVKKNILNVVLVAILYMITMIIGIFTARILGPDGTGHFQVFTSTQSIIATIFSFGLGQASIYYINSKGYSLKYVISSLMKFYIPLLVILCIVVVLLVYLFSGYFGRISWICMVLYSIGTSALLFTTSLRAILLANFNVEKVQIVQYIGQLFVLVAVLFFFIYDYNLSVNSLLIIYSIGSLISAFWLYSYFAKIINWKLPFDFNLFRPLCKLGVTMSASNLASVFFISSPVYALTWLYKDGFTQAGIYSRSLSIMTIATFTIQAIGPLLYAKLSQVTEEQKVYQVKVSATAFFIFNVIMFIVLELCAGLIVSLLYGSEFIEAASYLRVLALSLFFNGILTVCTNVLSSKGMANKVFHALVWGTLSLWIAMLASSITHWPISIAYCVVIGNIITSVLLMLQVTKIMDITFWDFIPTRFSQFTSVLNIIRTGLR